MSESEIIAYLYAKFRLGDHLAATAAVYIAQHILGVEPAGFYPVVDGVDNDELKLWDVAISSVMEFEGELINTIDKIVDTVKRVDDRNIEIISLMALILLASKYTTDPVDYLVRNGWISGRGRQILNKAEQAFRLIKIQIRD